MEIEKLSLAKRVDNTGFHPRFSPAPEEDRKRPLKKIPLAARVREATAEDPSFSYKKDSIEKAPFAERLAAAQRGWFWDPSAPVEMMERSAAVPLEEILTDDLIGQLRSKSEKIGAEDRLPATLGEAAPWIEEFGKEYFLVGILHDLRVMPDLEWSAFLKIWSTFSKGVYRSGGRGSIRARIGHRIDRLLPVVTLPLPLYFQAALERRESEAEKERLLDLYQTEVLPLRGRKGDLASHANHLLQSMNEEMEGSEEMVRLAYDLIIEPFLWG